MGSSLKLMSLGNLIAELVEAKITDGYSQSGFAAYDIKCEISFREREYFKQGCHDSRLDPIGPGACNPGTFFTGSLGPYVLLSKPEIDVQKVLKEVRKDTFSYADSSQMGEIDYDYGQALKETSDKKCIGCYRLQELDKIFFVGTTNFCIDCYPKFSCTKKES